MYRVMLFDLDGTLVDTVEAHAQAWHQAFAASGIQVPVSLLRQHIGQGGDQLLPVFLTPEQCDRLGPQLEQRHGAIYRESFLPATRPFPGVRELMLRVRALGIEIGIASSSKQPELQHYLSLLDIRELIQSAPSAEEVAHTKPAPDVVQQALGGFTGVAPGEAVMVGDSPYDALAATAAGVHSWSVRCGGFRDHVLLAAGTEQIVDDPADLLVHLDALVGISPVR